jgi:hypothetical protein
MTLEITKIDGGLRWSDIDRHFTNMYLPNGFDIQSFDIAQIELNNQIFLLCSNDSKIDGLSFPDIQSEIAYIFNLP